MGSGVGGVRAQNITTSENNDLVSQHNKKIQYCSKM